MNQLNESKHHYPYIIKGDSLLFDKNLTLCDISEDVCRQFPDKIAVSFLHHQLTFHQLNAHANQLAHYLHKRDINPRDKIILFIEPGIELITAILALFKMGAIYVPVEAGYPENRIKFMIKDSEAKLIISTRHLIEKNHIESDSLLFLNEVHDEIESQPITFVSETQSSDIAYMIYTSGSTGVPKGVLISHLALNNHMFWLKTTFDITEHDHILQKTPISFDPSIWELLAPFYTGAQLCIAPKGSHVSPDALIELIISEHITVIQLVPSVLKILLQHKRIKRCQSLKLVFCGGETLRPEIKTLFFDVLNCQLINLYGPTEATIDITSHTIKNISSDLHTNCIGKAIINTSLYVVNEQGEALGINEEGELLIGSLSLARGYHNRPSLTEEKFIKNPFEPERYPMLYKTGDMVRFLQNGTIEFLGRNNDQVKINGVRVEPKEIILTVLEHPEISDCIIIKKTDSHGHDFLACYLTTKKNKSLPIAKIKKHLKTRFPDYMLPRTYYFLESIPLTVNGKIDHQALPEPDYKASLHTIDENNPLEKLIAIWQIVLETNDISEEDDFFELGGNSLLALKLITMIQDKFHVTIQIRAIYEYTTIRLQLDLIKQLSEMSGQTFNQEHSQTIPNPIICLQPNGKKTPLFLIHPIGGTIFWFSKLARALKKSRPVYGIQDPGIDLEKEVFSSIREMAEFYLDNIRKKQKKGPYLIGGASFGVTVAVEIANILQEEGETVSSIINLDGWAVYPDILLDDNYFKQSMQRQHTEIEEDFKHYGLPCPTIIFNIQWSRLKLLWNYKLQLIEAPMALFKSEELLPAFAEIDAPLNHWEKYSSSPIQRFSIPGNHESMFQEPHVFTLAEKLETYLNQEDI